MSERGKMVTDIDTGLFTLQTETGTLESTKMDIGMEKALFTRQMEERHQNTKIKNQLIN